MKILLFLIIITQCTCSDVHNDLWDNTPSFVPDSPVDKMNSEVNSIVVKKGRLQPSFCSSTEVYLDAPIPFSDSATPSYNDSQYNEIIVTAAVPYSSIQINGMTASSGVSFRIDNLKPGNNPVLVTVTSYDKTSTNSYTVNMYRAVPIFKTGAGLISGYTLNSLEDGSTQRGVNLPSGRFTNNGSGTISDKLTGLTWSKNTIIISSPKNFTLSLTYADELVLGSADDWRIPNSTEFSSLFSYEETGLTSYLSSFFDNINATDTWWTSSNNLTTVQVYNLKSCISSSSGISNSNNLWAVRGESEFLPQTGQTQSHFTNDDAHYMKGVAWPELRFCDNNDGTITDNMTSLMWFREVLDDVEAWSDAIDHVETKINSGVENNHNYKDWFIPNIRELQTLLNFRDSNSMAWLDENGFYLRTGFFWSSTTQFTVTGYVYQINFSTNQFQYNDKSATIYFTLPARLIKPGEMTNY